MYLKLPLELRLNSDDGQEKIVTISDSPPANGEGFVRHGYLNRKSTFVDKSYMEALEWAIDSKNWPVTVGSITRKLGFEQLYSDTILELIDGTTVQMVYMGSYLVLLDNIFSLAKNLKSSHIHFQLDTSLCEPVPHDWRFVKRRGRKFPFRKEERVELLQFPGYNLRAHVYVKSFGDRGGDTPSQTEPRNLELDEVLKGLERVSPSQIR